MSSVANGFKFFEEDPAFRRADWVPLLVQDVPAGDVERPRLEETRLASSVDAGEISIPLVTSKAEVIFFELCWKSYSPATERIYLSIWVNFGVSHKPGRYHKVSRSDPASARNLEG